MPGTALFRKDHEKQNTAAIAKIIQTNLLQAAGSVVKYCGISKEFVLWVLAFR